MKKMNNTFSERERERRQLALRSAEDTEDGNSPKSQKRSERVVETSAVGQKPWSLLGMIADDITPKISQSETAFTLRGRDYKGVMVVVLGKYSGDER